MAMGVVVLSSAAFAGTTSVNYRGIASGSALADTVVPNDTVVPEQKDTAKTETDPVQFALNDTVVPEQKDTAAPEKQSEGEVQSLVDTLTPAKSL